MKGGRGERPQRSPQEARRGSQEASEKSPRSLQEAPKKPPKGHTTTGAQCYFSPLGELRRSASQVEVGHGGAHD